MEVKKTAIKSKNYFIICVSLILLGVVSIFILASSIIYTNETNTTKNTGKNILERIANDLSNDLDRINKISMSLFLTSSFQEEIKNIYVEQDSMDKIVNHFENVAISDYTMIKNVVFVPCGDNGEFDFTALINYGSNYENVSSNIKRIAQISNSPEYGDGRIFYTPEYYKTSGNRTGNLAFVRVVKGVLSSNMSQRIGLGVVLVQSGILKNNINYAKALNGFKVGVWDQNANFLDKSNVLFSSDDNFTAEKSKTKNSLNYTTSTFSWEITGYFDSGSVIKKSYYTFLIVSFILVIACFGLSTLCVFIHYKNKQALNYLYVQFGNRKELLVSEMGHIEYTTNEQVNKVVESFNELSDSVCELNKVINEHEKKELSLELDATKFKFESLYSQINKHFLINILAIIRSLVRFGELDKANYCLDNLSAFLRTILTIEEKTIVQKEIETIESYVNLQLIRYPKVHCEFKYDEEVLSESIPKMILQPLVENVFSHGIKNKNGQIVITLKKRTNGLSIFVMDNGVGVSKDREIEINESLRKIDAQVEAKKKDEILDNHNGIALVNLQKRLTLLTSEKSFVRLRSTPQKGTVVVVYIANKIDK